MQISVKGRDIFAATGGTRFDPKLPTVIFIHGASLDHSCWPLQSRWFAWHGYGVLAIDLPGHGRSAGPALESVDEMAECIVDLLEAVGAVRPVLVGHSMGAAVALEVAARLGDGAGKLALLGVSEAIPVHPALLADALERPEQACLSMTAWGHGPAGHVGGNRAPGMWMMGGAVRLFGAAAAGVLHTDLKACDDWKTGPQAAGKVTCPTLFLLGGRDRMTPARSARKLAAMISGSRVQVIDKSGHMLMNEAPDETLDALVAFVTGE